MTTTCQADAIQTTVVRTIEQVEEFVSEWESASAKYAQVVAAQNDPIRYLAELRVQAGRILPHIAIFRDKFGLKGIIVGKEFYQKALCQIGYLKIPLVTLKCFAVAYGGLICDESQETWDAMFEYLGWVRAEKEIDYFVINHLPVSHPLFSRLGDLEADIEVADVHWRLHLAEGVEKSLSHRSPKTRGTMRRHDKRLADQFKNGLRLRRWELESEVAEFCTIAGQIAAKGYQGAMNVGFSDTPLWRSFVKAEAKRERMRCYTLEGDGAAIAFQVGVVRRGVYTMEETAFLPQYRLNSPGRVLLVRIIDDLCQSNIRAIDYGLGDSYYKQLFGSERTEEITLCYYGSRIKARFAKNTLKICDKFTGVVKGAIRLAGLYDWVKRKWRRRLETQVTI